MSFERKSLEQILQSMVDWTRGVTTSLTDFRVGSKIRSIYESVALSVEELYDKVYRNIKVLIEENVYTVFGFPKRQATYATGLVRFSRQTPADADYLISAGTLVKTRATQNMAPIQYKTTEAALLSTGETYVDVPVVCLTAGKVGNVQANSIVDFVTKPSGIDAVTNPSAFSNALDTETKDEQKLRFTKFINSLSRGTLAAIEYGALTAELKDSDGLVIERIVSSKAFEELPDRKGEVDLYVWNGVGEASAELLEEVEKVIVGYYNADGEPVYGYKPAGVIVNIYSASVVEVYIKLEVTPEDGVDLEDLKPYIEREIDSMFAALKLGQTLIQTALETQIKLIAGVMDVKLWLSTDGVDYSQDNITSGDTEILQAVKPIIYE